jgi:hypothetical protein
MVAQELDRMQFNTVNRPDMQEFPMPMHPSHQMGMPGQMHHNRLTIIPPQNLPKDSGRKANGFGIGVGSEFTQSQVIQKFEVNPNNLISYEAKNKFK